jgi:hypothetical protein
MKADSAMHSGHRAMLLLILSQIRNDWDSVPEQIRSWVVDAGHRIDKQLWVSWYSAVQQAEFLNVNERHARTLIDDLVGWDRILRVKRLGQSAILLIDTRGSVSMEGHRVPEELPGRHPRILP